MVKRPVARRKRPDRYHHGDLRRALLEQARLTIAANGVDGLTLRGVGAALGVSRTALYRHFADKTALLSAVAAEGFRRLRDELAAACGHAGGTVDGFEDMGIAYVRFAVRNPQLYRVMFGPAVAPHDPESELARDGAAAFQVLLDSLLAQQREQLVPAGDDPVQLARFVWAMVHGIAMLAIDERLGRPGAVDAFTAFTVARIRSGLAHQSEPDAGS
jgi:AcrR family transcriptional regulator